jgi:hypothetical protein
MEPQKFRAYLEVEVGKKTADHLTVAPGRQGERTDVNETSHHSEGKSVSPAKEERLRAILRAPELVQDLYREGLVTQATAAKLGPKRPTPERAVRVVEARQALEQLGRALPVREYRREAVRR